MALFYCAAEQELHGIMEVEPASTIHPSHDVEQSRIPKAGKIILQRLDTHHMSVSTVTQSF